MSEYIYLGHDNGIDFQLKSDGVVIDMSNVTRMTCEFGATVIDSAISPDAFDWTTDATTGKLYLTFGDETIPTGTYNAVLTVYDVVNDDGIVWDSFKCKVE